MIYRGVARAGRAFIRLQGRGVCYSVLLSRTEPHSSACGLCHPRPDTHLVFKAETFGTAPALSSFLRSSGSTHWQVLLTLVLTRSPASLYPRSLLHSTQTAGASRCTVPLPPQGHSYTVGVVRPGCAFRRAWLPSTHSSLVCFWNIPSSFLSLGLYTSGPRMLIFLLFTHPAPCHLKIPV